MRILIVEDEEVIASNIQLVLKGEGFAPDRAKNGEEAIFKSLGETFDAIILDWMLPDIDGLEVLKTLRKEKNNSPVIFLSAKSQLGDKLKALSAGADDYLTKPFAMEELIERVKALVRRTYPDNRSPQISCGPLVIDTNTHIIKVHNETVNFSPKEYKILEYLARNKNRACERLEIMSHVWGEEIDEFSNTVDVHIRYLRRKLAQLSVTGLIQTVKGTGYMLCCD